MKKNQLAAAVMYATVILFSPAVLADGSEGEATPEEREAKAREAEASKPVEVFAAHLDDLYRRYPDSEKVDIDRLLDEEGEKTASLYCSAVGFDGPCVPVEEGGKTTFVKANAKAVWWWYWLRDHFVNIGVIPEQNYCAAPYAWSQIHMDDEDRRNANSRWGWLGATVSNNNTTWRFCRLPWEQSRLFRPLPFAGDQHDYAVLSMGWFCPSGARHVFRFEDNEDNSNANSSFNIGFPNVIGANSLVVTCHFDGAASSYNGHMAAFPNLGMKYGVFAPTNMPSRYALQHGYVYQDDEDNWNINSWLWTSLDTVMGGGSNTWRALAKVQ